MSLKLLTNEYLIARLKMRHDLTELETLLLERLEDMEAELILSTSQWQEKYIALAKAHEDALDELAQRKDYYEQVIKLQDEVSDLETQNLKLKKKLKEITP